MSVKRSIYSKFRDVLLQSVVPLTAAIVIPAVFAQPALVVKNWPMSAASAPSTAATGSGAGLVFIAIAPCRVMDTRGAGGSGKTGAFGAPSLVAGQARVVPVPSSNCGVPAAVAYSMNFVSITPAGQPVGWIAAWQDDKTWPGTVVLNAVQGGFVDNSAIVPAGADGGIQVQATDNADLVIDTSVVSRRDAVAAVLDHLTRGGMVLINVGHPRSSDRLEKVLGATMGTVFKRVLRDPAADS